MRKYQFVLPPCCDCSGDRHPDNIIVTEKGDFFHIDFEHFLGNFKSRKLIGGYSWVRERPPFVFLPAYKHCIDNGNKDKDKYNEFLQFATNAYLALRQRHKLLINLFILMLPSQMPELIQRRDINYLRDQLHLASSEGGEGKSKAIKNENVYKHISKLMNSCLKDKTRIMENIVHAVRCQ